MRDFIAASCLGPPRRSLCIALGIGIMRLLLRLDQLDKGFAHDLAGTLLHVLEADIVELFYFFLVADGQELSLSNINGGHGAGSDRNWGTFIVEEFSVHWMIY